MKDGRLDQSCGCRLFGCGSQVCQCHTYPYIYRLCFRGINYVPFTEEDMTEPTGVYGKTKLAGEEAVVNSGCNYIILRTAWLYSAWGKNFVKTMLKLTEEKDILPVIFDQIGTPTFAGDLADAIGWILDRRMTDKKGIYHFSNEGVCSWYDFAAVIARLAGNECDVRPIHTFEYPSKVKRPHYSVLDKRSSARRSVTRFRIGWNRWKNVSTR